MVQYVYMCNYTCFIAGVVTLKPELSTASIGSVEGEREEERGEEGDIIHRKKELVKNYGKRMFRKVLYGMWCVCVCVCVCVCECVRERRGEVGREEEMRNSWTRVVSSTALYHTLCIYACLEYITSYMYVHVWWPFLRHLLNFVIFVASHERGSQVLLDVCSINLRNQRLSCTENHLMLSWIQTMRSVLTPPIPHPSL